MNHVYRVIFNRVLGVWQAVTEHAKSQGKVGGSVKRSFRRHAARLAAVAAMATGTGGLGVGAANAQQAPAPNQLPQGGNVTAGDAQINQSGNVMNIDQSTQRAIINWQEFNVGQDATVNFNQPNSSAATLNRVLDSNPSQIFGQIVAPGQVILINPNGAYFAPSASVDVGGLIATTHELADRDFLDGNYQFKRNGATGKIINEGELKAKLDGYIALMAPEVRNQGVIIAERGTVALASGEHIQLDFGSGNKLQGITVTEQDFNAQVENRHLIVAEGGLVIMSARATAELRASVIKNSGQIVASAGANTVTMEGGRIILDGGATGDVQISGELIAQGKNPTKTAKGGEVQVLGRNIELAANAKIDVSGDAGGGTVLVGGNSQGKGSEQNADTVTIGKDATIIADATHQGDGGTVVVWSEALTQINGTISAKGGPEGGTGGTVETGSRGQVTVTGAVVTAAPNRPQDGGQWLISGEEIELASSASLQTILTNQALGQLTAEQATTAAKSLLDASSIAKALVEGTGVSIVAANTISGVDTIDRTGVQAELTLVQNTATANSPTEVQTGVTIASNGNEHYTLFLNGQDLILNSRLADINGHDVIIKACVMGCTVDDAGEVFIDMIAGIQSLDVRSNLDTTISGGIEVSGLLNLNALTLDSSNVTIVAQSLNIDGSVNVSSEAQNQGGANLTIRPQDASQSIQVGGVQDTQDSQDQSSTLTLNTSTLQSLNDANLASLTLGSEDQAGSIQINSTIQSAGDLTLQTAGQLQVHVTAEVIAAGDVTLKGGDITIAGKVLATETANSPNAESSIKVDATNSVTIDGSLAVDSAIGQGGLITIEGVDITLTENAKLTATGATGGGNILVGGDWQGGANVERRVFDDPNALRQAVTVTMASGAFIDASATDNGDGGTVVLWSDITNSSSVTAAHGTIYAKGGANGGDGGQIETSGYGLLTLGVHGSAAAANGKAGEWLFDPAFIKVVSAHGGSLQSPNYTATNFDVTILNTSIESFLNGGTSVTLTATDYIELLAHITKTAGGEATLTLKSNGFVKTAGYTISSTQGQLNVVLWVEADGGGSRGAYVGDIRTNGGHVWVGGGAGTSKWNGLTVGNGLSMSDGTANWNGLDLAGDILTTGGSIYLAADEGNSTSNPSIGSIGSTRVLDAGTGDITLIVRNASNFRYQNQDIRVETSGTLTIAPPSGEDWVAGSNIQWGALGNPITGLQINTSTGTANLGGLNIGTWSGTGVPGDTAYIAGHNQRFIAINSDISIAGSIAIEGGLLSISSHLTANGAGSRIFIKTNEHPQGGNATDGVLYVAPNKNLTSGGGDIVLWSNATNRTSGTVNNEIILAGNNTLTSNGGRIVLAGGLDDGSNGGIANDGIPDGYAYRGGYSGSAIDMRNNVSLLSGGGDVIIRGHSNPSGVAGSFNGSLRGYGVQALSGFVINSGSGTINIKGLSNSDHAVWFDDGNVAITSASTAATAISIFGESSINFAGFGTGFNSSSSGGHTLIQATGSAGGGITIEGKNTANQTLWLGNNNVNGTFQVISNAGDIKLIANNQIYMRNQDVYLGSRKDTNQVAGVTPSVTSSSANVLIRADYINEGANDDFIISTTGSFTFEPFGTAWSTTDVGQQIDLEGSLSGNNFSGTGDVAWLNILGVSNLTGLTIGKEGNTSAIKTYTPWDINGPISLLGGNITVDHALTAAGDITIKAGGNNDVLVSAAITNQAASATSLTIEAGRHIRLNSAASISASEAMNSQLWADTDKSGDGIIYFASSGITTSGGSLTFGKAGQKATFGGTEVLVGGDVYFIRDTAQTLSTSGGAVNIFGETIVANTAGLTINSGNGNVTLHGLLNSGNQYAAVSGTWTWEQARDNAKTQANSYLATITSRLENSIAGLAVNYQSAWLGGLRNPSDNEWRWVTDPDYHATNNPLIFFYQGQSTPIKSTSIGVGGSTAPGFFANWNRWEEGQVTSNPEPNNSGSNERALQFTGSQGLWNDLPHNSSQLSFYVRETAIDGASVIINAGTGVVSISGDIGGSKALDSLLVTADSIVLPDANTRIVAREDLVFNASVVHSGASNITLTATAGDDIYFNGDIRATAAGTLNLNLTGARYSGVIAFEGDITTKGGSLTATAETISFQATSNQTVDTSAASGTGGAVTFSNVGNTATNVSLGVLNNGNAGTLTLKTGDGAVSVTGTVNSAISVQRQTVIGSGLNGWTPSPSSISTYSTGDAEWGTILGVFDNGGDSVSRALDFEGDSKNISFDFYQLESWDGELVRFYVGSTLLGSRTLANGSEIAELESVTSLVTGYGITLAPSGGHLRRDLRTANNNNWTSQKIAVSIDTPALGAFTFKVDTTLDQAWKDEGWGIKNFLVRDVATAYSGNAALTIDSGAGNISVSGAMGSIGALGVTDITGAAVTLSSSVALGSGQSLTVTNSGASSIAGAISGTGATVTKEGTGTLTLSGASSYTGATNINAGVLKLGSAGSGSNSPLGTTAGATTIADGAALDLAGYTLATAAAITISGTGVSNSGAIYNSTGTAVTWSGATTLDADATIKSANGGALTWNGTINGPYALTIDTEGATDASFTLGGIVGGSSEPTGLTINSGTANATVSANATVAGAISISGGTVALNGNLTSQASSGAGITISSQKITQAPGVSVTTHGADINYTATGGAFTSGNDIAINIGAAGGSTATVDADGGNVTLLGSFGSTGVAGGNDFAVLIFETEIKTSGTGRISITGDAANTITTSSSYGVSLGNNTLIQTEDGSITLIGTGGKASGNSRGVVVDQQAVKVLSASGDILIEDLKPTGLTGTYTGLYLRPSTSSHIYLGSDGTTILSGASSTASASNITILADRVSFVSNGSYYNQINTAGAVVVESVGSTFGSTADISNLAIANGSSSVRLGKSTNTADITIGRAISAAGPIEIYGGAVTLNNSLTTTDTTGGNISITTSVLTGSGGMLLAAGRNLIVTQSGNSTYTGIIAGSDATFTKFGAGILTLGGASTYTGGTTISAGTLKVGGATVGNPGSITSSPLGTGTVTVNSGAALDLAGYRIANALTLSGIGTGSGATSSGALYNSSAAQAVSHGLLTLAADTTIKNNGALILDGNVSGAHALTVTNTGKVTFGGLIGSSSTKLSSLSIASDADLIGDVWTSGAQSYGADVGVGANISLNSDSGGVSITGAVGGLAPTLIYQTTNPTRVNNAIVYSSGYGLGTGNAAADFDNGFYSDINRITYRMEVLVDGTLRYAEVTFDAWANSLTAQDLRIPDRSAGNEFVIQQIVNNMTVESNMDPTSKSSGVMTGTGLTGYLEIWPWNYAAAPTVGEGFPTGSDLNGTRYDFNDSPNYRDSYGSFQVHNITTSGSEQTVLAWNRHYDVNPDIGLGNSTTSNPDWTFTSGDSLGKTDWKLQISVNKVTPDLAINAGSGAVSIAGNVANLSSLTVNSDSALSAIDGAMSGSMDLTKQGSGTLTLTANSTYTGATSISNASGTLVLSNNAPTTASSSFLGAGTLRIEPSGDDFSATFDTGTAGFAFGSTLGSLTIGKASGADGNTDADVTVGSAISIAGPITVYGGSISVNQNLSSSATGAAILLKASGNISTASSRTITTNNGDIVFWADADASGAGSISIGASNTLNSANGASTSGLSGGGDIVLGGGADTDSDGIPDGYAISSSAPGIRIQGGAAIRSGGGNITIRGKSTNTTSGWDAVGLRQEGNLVMDSGTGRIILAGQSDKAYGIEMQAGNGAWSDPGSGTLSIQSAAATGTAISIVGSGYGSYGVLLNYGRQKTIAATGGGDIVIEGTTTSDTYAGEYAGDPTRWGVFFGDNTSLLAASGTISVDGGTEGIRTRTGITLGRQSSSLVTTSSADIVLIGDKMQVDGTPGTGIATSGAVTIESSGASFAGALTYPFSNLSLSSDVSSLTIGKSGNTANITIGSATTVAGPIAIYGGDITINAALTATSSTITLVGSGNVTSGASGYVVADGLALLGGDVTLDSASNNVGTIAASGVGDLIYLDSDDLIIGEVNPTGISASGDVFIATVTGDLTIAEDISTTSASLSAIVIAAGTSASAGVDGAPTSGNILIDSTSGIPSLSVASGGTIGLYTGDVSGSTGLSDLVGSGTGRFRYNTSIDSSGVVTAGYTTTLATNVVNALYRQQPTVSGDISSQTITYGEDVPDTSSFTLSNGTGIQNGDSSSGFTIDDDANLSSAGLLRVKSGGYSVTASGLSALGYDVGSVNTGTLTVDPITLTVSGLTASSKTYDGSDLAILSNNGSLDGVVIDDVVSFSTVATFNNKNVETTKTLNLDYTLSGDDIGNYVLLDQTGVSTNALIEAKVVTLSAARVYDGTDNLTGVVTIVTGVTVGGVTETLTYSDAVAASPNVATADNYITSITLGDAEGATEASGGLASNYQLPTLDAINAPVTISPLTVTLVAPSVTKTYDGDLSYIVTASDLTAITQSGALANGETIDDATISFASKNVGAGDRTITLDSVRVSSANSNYDFTLDGNSLSTIERLDSVTWIGGATGEWFDPANWGVTGDLSRTGVVPDLANVAEVIVGAGVDVSFDEGALAGLAEAGTVSLDALTFDSINASSNLSLVDGALNVSGTATLGGFEGVAGTTFTTGTSLSIDNALDQTFAGVIDGSGALTKSGAGTLTLSGANVYEGGTTISNAGGTLVIANNAPSTRSAGFFGPGALRIESVAGSFTNPFTYSSIDWAFDGTLGGLTIGKAGNSANVALNSGITIAGPITIYGSTITVADKLNTQSGGSAGAIELVAATGIDLSADLLSADLVTLDGAVILSDDVTVAGSTVEFKSTVDGNHELTVTGNAEFGANVGVGVGNALTSLNVTGTTLLGGNVTTSGAQTYSNTTTLSGDYILTGTGISLDAVTLGGYTLTVAEAGSGTIGGVISDGSTAGGLTMSGAGTLTMTANSTYTGATSISSGTLQIGNGGATGTLGNNSAATIGSGATLKFYRSDNHTIGSVLSGSGDLVFAGTGNTGESTYNISTASAGFTGDALIDSGARVSIGHSAALGSSDVTVYAGGQAVAWVNLSNDFTIAGDGWAETINSQLVRLGALRLGQNVTLSGDVTLTDNARITAYGALDSGTISGVVSGAYALEKTGVGLITLTGENTFDGGLTVSAGTLRIGAGGAVGSIADQAVINNASLIFSRSDDVQFAGAISGTGSLTKSGAGTLTLAVDNTYTGATSISAGTLQIGAGGTAGSLGSGTVTNNAALVFNRSDDVTVANSILGSGSVTKAGMNTLTLTANSAYTGATTIEGGVLVLSNNAPTTASSGFNGPGALRIESSGAGFTGNFSTAGWSFGSTLSELVIGKAGNTSGITIASTTSIAGPITIHGGDMAINSALTALSGNINLHATGNVTQTAAITAAGLGLHGRGDFTLTNTDNAVTTIAGGDSTTNLGGVWFVNAGALTIGSVNPEGITSSGDIRIETLTGDLTVTEDIASTSNNRVSVVLVAGKDTVAGVSTGGDIKITHGATITVESDSQALLYTGSLSGTTGVAETGAAKADGLISFGSGRFRYNADETTDFSAGGWLDLAEAGLYAIYREQPTVIVTALNNSIVYGEVAPTTYERGFTGLFNGDSSEIFTGDVSWTTTPTGNPNDPSSTGISSAGLLEAGVMRHAIGVVISADDDGLTNRLGYRFLGDVQAALTVVPKTVTVTGLRSASKVYDGTQTAIVLGRGSLDGSVAVADGNFNDGFIIIGDDVSVRERNLDPALDIQAKFDSKDVLTATKVSFSDVLVGADAANYTYVIEDTSARITPKIVRLSASKVYDGTEDLTGHVTVATGVTVNGQVEILSYEDVVAAFKHVVNDTPNYIKQISLLDGDELNLPAGSTAGLASNYIVSPTLDATTAPVTITPRTLELALSNQDGKPVVKIYDGTRDAPSIGFDPVFNVLSTAEPDEGFVATDTGATFSFASALYNSKDVLLANNVVVSGIQVVSIDGDTGSKATDYEVKLSSLSIEAQITPRPVTFSAEKTYDGTTDLTGVVEVMTEDSEGNLRSIFELLGESLVVSGAQSASKDVVARDADGNEFDNYITGTGLSVTDGEGGLVSNYLLPTTFDMTTGPVTITPARLEVRAADDAKLEGTNDFAGYAGAIFNGFVNGETPLDLGGLLTISRDLLVSNDPNEVLSNELVGRYQGVLRPEGLTSENYEIVFEKGDFTIVGPNTLLLRSTVSGTQTYGSAPVYTLATAQYLNGAAVIDLTLSSADPNTAPEIVVSGANVTVGDPDTTGATFSLVPVAAQTSRAGLIRVGGYNVQADDVVITGDPGFTSVMATGGLLVTPKEIPLAVDFDFGETSKIYDGSTSIAGLQFENLEIPGIESSTATPSVKDDLVLIGSGSFDDRHVGSGKTVTLRFALDGDDAVNYKLSSNELSNHQGTITQRESVTFVGRDGALWSDGRAWEGGATPDRISIKQADSRAEAALQRINWTPLADKDKESALEDLFALSRDAGNDAIRNFVESHNNLSQLDVTDQNAIIDTMINLWKIQDNVGTVVISGKTVVYDVDRVGATGSDIVFGQIDNRSGRIEVQSSTEFDLSNQLTGSGELAQTGQGILTVTGDNNAFTGVLDIGSGQLVIGTSTSAGIDVKVRSDGGTLALGLVPNSDDPLQLEPIVLNSLRVTGSVTIAGLGSGSTGYVHTVGDQVYDGSLTFLSSGVPSVSDSLGVANFLSLNGDIEFNGTVSAGVGAKGDGTLDSGRSLVVQANNGRVTFGDQVGMAVKNLLFTSQYQGNQDVNPWAVQVQADEIYVLGDITTFETQLYDGPVFIGDNGSNGFTRTLISLDPNVTFLSTVDAVQEGVHSLDVRAYTLQQLRTEEPSVEFYDKVGSIRRLRSLNVETGLQDNDPLALVATPLPDTDQAIGRVLISDNISTTGNQRFLTERAFFDPAVWSTDDGMIDIALGTGDFAQAAGLRNLRFEVGLRGGLGAGLASALTDLGIDPSAVTRRILPPRQGGNSGGRGPVFDVLSGLTQAELGPVNLGELVRNGAASIAGNLLGGSVSAQVSTIMSSVDSMMAGLTTVAGDQVGVQLGSSVLLSGEVDVGAIDTIVCTEDVAGISLECEPVGTAQGG